MAAGPEDPSTASWNNRDPKKYLAMCPGQSTIHEIFEMNGPDAELELGGPRIGERAPLGTPSSSSGKKESPNRRRR